MNILYILYLEHSEQFAFRGFINSSIESEF
jgi:hypothetical protein